MTAAQLVVLRHGRTEWNAAGRLQGQADVPLDARGLVQAEQYHIQGRFGDMVDLLRRVGGADAGAQQGLVGRRRRRDGEVEVDALAQIQVRHIAAAHRGIPKPGAKWEWDTHYSNNLTAPWSVTSRRCSSTRTIRGTGIIRQ